MACMRLHCHNNNNDNNDNDPAMTTVREFQEKSMRSGRHSFVKDAYRLAVERKLHLQLDNPETALIKEDGELIIGSRVKAGMPRCGSTAMI